MPTDADRAFARAEILEACQEAYETSPAAWVGWEREDVPEYDLLETAARALADEGLIKATFDEEGAAVEAQLTAAGVRHVKGGGA